MNNVKLICLKYNVFKQYTFEKDSKKEESEKEIKENVDLLLLVCTSLLPKETHIGEWQYIHSRIIIPCRQHQ